MGTTMPPARCLSARRAGERARPRPALEEAGQAPSPLMRPPSPVRRASRGRSASSDTSPVCSPTISPSYITRMRSESDRISSSSSETSRIARPSSRSVTSRRWRYSIAPTSSPRVGCAAISTFGSRSISRAATSFCWLPPERPPARVNGPPPRTSNSRIRRSRPLDHPAREEPAEARVRRLRVVVQRDVLGDRELEHEPAPLPVLGNVPDSGVERRPRRRRARVRDRRCSPSRSRSCGAR